MCDHVRIIWYVWMCAYIFACFYICSIRTHATPIGADHQANLRVDLDLKEAAAIPLCQQKIIATDSVRGMLLYRSAHYQEIPSVDSMRVVVKYKITDKACTRRREKEWKMRKWHQLFANASSSTPTVWLIYAWVRQDLSCLCFWVEAHDKGQGRKWDFTPHWS